MLLSNIIPHHVVEEIKLSGKYSESHDMVAVMFASITNWNEMYEESFEGEQPTTFELTTALSSAGGLQFMRFLNEVMCDFDDLLERFDFSHVEKIKVSK